MKSYSKVKTQEHRHTGFSTLDLARCGLFVALMAIGAKIHIMIPIGGGVTVSLQIMFALLSGFVLGARRGFESVLVYLIIGLIGIPVYAHGGGPAYLIKPTYGFLIGFLTAAALADVLIRRFKKRTRAAYIISAELAMLSYYVCGLLYFYFLSNFLLGGSARIGIRDLIVVWFLSSVGPDLIIAAVAGLAAYRLVPAVEKMQE